ARWCAISRSGAAPPRAPSRPPEPRGTPASRWEKRHERYCERILDAGARCRESRLAHDRQAGNLRQRALERRARRARRAPCGGLELALACRYRVGVADDRLSLGLPEVQLGIHPGFGGTVRSVRTLGVRPAMEMMLTGKPVRAEKALRLGLVDRLVPEAQLRSA